MTFAERAVLFFTETKKGGWGKEEIVEALNHLVLEHARALMEEQEEEYQRENKFLAAYDTAQKDDRNIIDDNVPF